MKYFLYVLLLIGLFSSCASRRDVIYFQQNQQVLDSAFSVKYSTIKPFDRLSILVAASDPEVVTAFTINMQGNMAAAEPMEYTVSEQGTIVLPYLGEVSLIGKGRIQAIEHIRTALTKYIKDPVVNITIKNFQVTVLGATGPSILTFTNNDRPTILEAIARSGDLSITAKRNDILVVREEGGKRKSYRLDIRDAAIMDSPAYYLAQNDIIYVEPNTTGIQGNRNTWYLTLGMTVITVGLTIYSLFK